MQEYDYIYGILIIIAAVLIFVPLLQCLKASPIIGYLVAGIVLHNSGIAVVENAHFIKSLAEFGIVFLLFTIGLELSLSRIIALRWYIFGLGMLQVLITALICGSIAYWLGFSIEASLVIGVLLALSSTATIIQLLCERKEMFTGLGRISIAVLLFQDLAVIPLLVIVPIISGDNVDLFSALSMAIMKAIFAIGIILIMARIFIHPLYNIVVKVKSPELFVAATLFVIFLVSLITATFGMSMALGAFLAGLVLAESQYRHQIEADIMPFRGILLGLFFITIGMRIDLTIVTQYCAAVLLILVTLLLTKILILTLLAMSFKLSRFLSLRVGLVLSQGSEFAFIVLVLAMENNIIPHYVSQILFAVISLSIITTPYLAALGKLLTDKFQHTDVHPTLLLGENKENISEHVIIAGFGKVGNFISQLLAKDDIPFIAIDSNVQRVIEAHAKQLPVYYGNASNIDIMRAAKIDRAAAVMIALNNWQESEDTVNFLRKHFPEIPIIACCVNKQHAQCLQALGANVSVPEMIEPTLRLGALLLEHLGKSEQEIQEYIEQFKEQYNMEEL